MSRQREAQRLQQALQQAVAAYQSGQLRDARRSCRDALKAQPDNAEVLHLLAIVEHGLGNSDAAIETMQRAVRFEPKNASVLSDLGAMHAALEQWGDAEDYLRRALAVDPDLVEANNNLGNVLSQQGKAREAEALYRRTLSLKPDYGEAQVNLGLVLRQTGRSEEAERHYRDALAVNPGLAQLHSNLGNVEMDLGRAEQAEQSYRRAVAIDPSFAVAWSVLGSLLRNRGRLDEAEQCCRRALAAQPGLAQAHCDLADVLKDLGRVDEAVQSYRQALALKPDLEPAHSSLLVALNYAENVQPAEIYAEHRAFARRFLPSADRRRHANSRDPERKLRIGYVSGDLRDHPVAQFLTPVLARHDRRAFEIFCYSNHGWTDATTAWIREHTDQWRDAFALRDPELFERITEDGIDLLVDLSGHSAFNRLSVFARKPAPVQATWLGYLNTTGLETMDYRITDRHASPEGLLDAFHSERLVRLPDSQWCYQPPADCPDVSEPPGAKTGRVTFASFSNLAKIGPGMIELWSRLLARVSGSRLLLVRRGLDSVASEYAARFARHGIASDRLELMPSRPFRDYLEMHRAADIVLDTFPYAGGTTTCHALWMGVPVIALTGQTATSRGAASILNVIGLEEFVANDPERYLEVAARLAEDPSRLAELRSGMRARMSASPLMDAARFTRNLEAAYRSMWRSWCAREAQQPEL